MNRKPTLGMFGYCLLGAVMFMALVQGGPVVAQTVSDMVVRLQDLSPGAVQTGHANISGTVRAGKVEARSALNSEPAARFENSETGRFVEMVGPNGAIVTNGVFMRDYGAGPKASIPVAYGSVSASGSVLGGSGNFSVGRSGSSYVLTFHDENVVREKTCLVTLHYSPATTGRGVLVRDITLPNELMVMIFDVSGNLTSSAFSFVLFRADTSSGP